LRLARELAANELGISELPLMASALRAQGHVEPTSWAHGMYQRSTEVKLQTSGAGGATCTPAGWALILQGLHAVEHVAAGRMMLDVGGAQGHFAPALAHALQTGLGKHADAARAHLAALAEPGAAPRGPILALLEVEKAAIADSATLATRAEVTLAGARSEAAEAAEAAAAAAAAAAGGGGGGGVFSDAAAAAMHARIDADAVALAEYWTRVVHFHVNAASLSSLDPAVAGLLHADLVWDEGARRNVLRLMADSPFLQHVATHTKHTPGDSTEAAAFCAAFQQSEQAPVHLAVSGQQVTVYFWERRVAATAPRSVVMPALDQAAFVAAHCRGGYPGPFSRAEQQQMQMQLAEEEEEDDDSSSSSSGSMKRSRAPREEDLKRAR